MNKWLMWAGLFALLGGIPWVGFPLMSRETQNLDGVALLIYLLFDAASPVILCFAATCFIVWRFLLIKPPKPQAPPTPTMKSLVKTALFNEQLLPMTLLALLSLAPWLVLWILKAQYVPLNPYKNKAVAALLLYTEIPATTLLETTCFVVWLTSAVTALLRHPMPQRGWQPSPTPTPTALPQRSVKREAQNTHAPTLPAQTSPPPASPLSPSRPSVGTVLLAMASGMIFFPMLYAIVRFSSAHELYANFLFWLPVMGPFFILWTVSSMKTVFHRCNLQTPILKKWHRRMVRFGVGCFVSLVFTIGAFLFDGKAVTVLWYITQFIAASTVLCFVVWTGLAILQVIRHTLPRMATRELSHNNTTP